MPRRIYAMLVAWLYVLDLVCGSLEGQFKSNISYPRGSHGRRNLNVYRRAGFDVTRPRGLDEQRHQGFVHDVTRVRGRAEQRRMGSLQPHAVHYSAIPHGFMTSRHLQRSNHHKAQSNMKGWSTNQRRVQDLPALPVPHTNIAPLAIGLQGYCSSKKGTIGMGSLVDGNWKGYGQFYKANVIKVNDDGTYDLRYHDGFVEERVPIKRVKVHPAEGPKVDPAMSDPVCKVANTVEGIKKRVDEAHEDIAIWLHQRKQAKEGKPVQETSADQQRTPQQIDGDVREVERQLTQKFGADKEAALAAADTDGDGYVSKEELQSLLQEQLGNPQGRAEQLAESVMMKLDKNEDGKISAFQYKGLLKSTGPKLPTAAKAPSPSDPGAGPRLAHEVGKELNDHFGSKEEALKEADVNKDNKVTKEELADVLEEDLGHTPERADELANATLSALDPDGTGAITADKFQELASTQGLAAASGKGAEQQERIEELEEEAAFHKEEHNKLREQLEELRKRMQASEEGGDDDPKTPEEKQLEIARLEAAMQAHSDELGHILGHDPDQESAGESKEDEEAAEDEKLGPGALLDVIKKHAEGVAKKTARLKQKMEQLRLDGLLDPELEHQVLTITISSDKMVGPMQSITADQRMASDNAEDQDEIQDDLVTDLEHLDGDILQVRKSTAEMDTEVIPGSTKWWRYRWEYCYVEALLLILLAILAIIWEGIYNLLRARINYLSTTSPFFRAAQHHNTLYFNWFLYMTGEFSVLLCVVFTLWVLDHLGLFELWISVQYDVAPEIHQPPTRNIYSRQAYDIAMQLFFAMAMFYGLVLSIVVSAVHKERNWKDFETGAAPTVRSSFSVVSVVNDDEEYNAMKYYFDETTSHDMGPTFQFWLYLSLNVRHNMTDIYSIKVLTWVVFLFIFIGFLFCHRLLHVSYIHLFLVFGVFDLLLFAGMIWMLHQEKVWLAKETQRTSDPERSVEHVPTIHEKYATERWVCIALQFLLFFLCYGIARIFCSPWTWLFYFWTALGMIVVFILFAILFRMYLAPTIITFMAIMSLPPYLDEGNKKMLSESCAEN